MSHYEQLTAYAYQNCCDVEHMDAPVLFHWLALGQLASFYVSLVIFIVAWSRHEIYILFFSLGLALDGLLNYGLQQLIQDPVPVDGCGGPYGMPSFQVQHTAFFVTFALTYAQFYKSHLRLLFCITLPAFLFWVCVAQILLNFNTPAQVIVGVLVGQWSIPYQIVLYFAVEPFFPTILGWRWVRTLGYVDTLCTGYNLKETGQRIEEIIEREFPGDPQQPLNLTKEALLDKVQDIKEGYE